MLMGKSILTSQHLMHTDLLQPGLMPYQQFLAQQQHHQNLLLRQPGHRQAVLIGQHPCCYTLGRGRPATHVRNGLAALPHPLYRIDRGGDITHHCPGQVVLYPILDLRRHQPDLHWYLRQLEAVALDVLAALDLPGQRLPGLTGVWCYGRKVAAVGVGARRWVTRHGLALNVTCDLAGFGHIVPCGIANRPVGRLCDWCPGLTCRDVEPLLLAATQRHLNLHLVPGSHCSLTPASGTQNGMGIG